MGILSGSDITKLAKLLSSTLSFDDLESAVSCSTGDRLYDFYVAKDQPKFPMIKKLLEALEELGTTADFLAYVYVNRPGRQDVRDAIRGYFPQAVAIRQKTIDLSAQTAGVPQADAPQDALAPGLQRNVRANLPQVDVRVWQEKLLRIERQVCRVEVEGTPLGTGFLVGPETVLTNWHVFETAEKAGKTAKIGCRFDYISLPSGVVQPGQLVALAADREVNSSPYAAAEATADPERPSPTKEELDYALLPLSSRVGDQQVEGAARGWISLPANVLPLQVDAPILIVQHPLGLPMKLALDTQAVIGLKADGARLRYRTNTDFGSSGSPVFNMDWDIVALHHFGDPNWQNPIFNQGVPIELIRQHITQKGFGNALGA